MISTIILFAFALASITWILTRKADSSTREIASIGLGFVGFLLGIPVYNVFSHTMNYLPLMVNLISGAMVFWEIYQKRDLQYKQHKQAKKRKLPARETLFNPNQATLIGRPTKKSKVTFWYDLKGHRLYHLPKAVRQKALEKNQFIGKVDGVWKMVDKKATEEKLSDPEFIKSHSQESPRKRPRPTKASEAVAADLDSVEKYLETVPNDLWKQDQSAPSKNNVIIDPNLGKRQTKSEQSKSTSTAPNYRPRSNKRFIEENSHFFMEWYYPLSRFPDDTLNVEQVNFRRFIWHFKDGGRQEDAAIMMADCLFNTFGPEFLRGKTLAVIPASSSSRTSKRFQRFAENLSYFLQIENGYHLITNSTDREPKHLGGASELTSTIQISEEVFGRDLIVIDDVITSGESRNQINNLLVSQGVNSVEFTFLAKTITNRY